MNREVQLMSDCNVADVVPPSALAYFTWVHRWTGIDIRSRLCVRGFRQLIHDLDDTFGPTPVLMLLDILFVFALSMQWSFSTYDITTARLPCMQYLIQMMNRSSLGRRKHTFPLKSLIWRLKRAVYGLRVAPRDWQKAL